MTFPSKKGAFERCRTSDHAGRRNKNALIGWVHLPVFRPATSRITLGHPPATHRWVIFSTQMQHHPPQWNKYSGANPLACIGHQNDNRKWLQELCRENKTEFPLSRKLRKNWAFGATKIVRIRQKHRWPSSQTWHLHSQGPDTKFWKSFLPQN